MYSSKENGTGDCEREFISICRLAKRWDYNVSTIYKWIDDGKIPALRLQFSRDKRNKWRIPMDWVLKTEKKQYLRSA